jgi:hypothetical protein
MLSERHEEYDGAIIAVFGDPGLGAARELYDLPVVGLAEAGMLTTCMLGGRFAIVTSPPRSAPGTKSACDGIVSEAAAPASGCWTAPFNPSKASRKRRRNCWLNWPCAPSTKTEPTLSSSPARPSRASPPSSDRLPVPVVDSIQAAVRQVETLVSLNVRPPTAGTYRRPAAKLVRGLSERQAGSCRKKS